MFFDVLEKLRRLPRSSKKKFINGLGLFLFLISFYLIYGFLNEPNYFISSVLGVLLLTNVKLYEGVLSEISWPWLLSRLAIASIFTSIAFFSLSLFLTTEASFSLSRTFNQLLIGFSFLTSIRLVGSGFLKNMGADSFSRVAIYGAGKAGMNLKNTLDKLKGYRVVCFIDDNSELQGRVTSGVEIVAREKAKEIVLEGMIDELVISIPSLSEDQWNDLLFGLKEFKVPIFKGPNLEEVIKGSTLSEIKPLSYEDLLGRSSVPPKRELLEGSVKDQVVLVTGAGGSIGGELTKR